MFGRFPLLRTQRLFLRRITEDDAEAFLSIFADDDVSRYLGRHPYTQAEQALDFIRRTELAFLKGEGIRWGLCETANGPLVGSCGHWRLMKDHRRSEIGYDLHRSVWGRGYMAEALRAILHHGFTSMGLHSVEAQVDPGNQRSRKVLTSLGFVQEGHLRESYFFDGRYYDTVYYGLLAREFSP